MGTPKSPAAPRRGWTLLLLSAAPFPRLSHPRLSGKCHHLPVWKLFPCSLGTTQLVGE